MMKKLWIALTAAVGMTLCGTLTVSAAETSLMDIGDYLTEEEHEELEEQLADVAYYTEMNVGIYLDNDSIPNDAVADTISALYQTEFGKETDGVYVYARLDEQGTLFFEMYTSGTAAQYYLDTAEEARLSAIQDDFWFYADTTRNDSMFDAVEMLCTNLEYYYFQGPAKDAASADMGDAPAESGEPEPSVPGNVLLYDEGGRLDADEYKACLGYLQDAANQTGMNVGMVLGSQVRSEYSIESIAVESYDQYFGYDDGLLYYMDLSGASEPYDYISTTGMGQFYYSNGDMANRIDAIFDDVFPYLYPKGAEDVVGAVEAFADDVVYYYNLGIPDNYYVYDDVYDEYFYVEDGEIYSSYNVPYIDWGRVVMMAFGGLIFGAIVGIIVFFGVKAHYKFKVSLSPTAYVNRKNLVFHNQYDRFIRTYTTKTKIESSSGGGGSRGGGGGRSSGGRGGGGRHR